eukprot:4396080-Lingulodinium_polyedra.AAC.1
MVGAAGRGRFGRGVWRFDYESNDGNSPYAIVPVWDGSPAGFAATARRSCSGRWARTATCPAAS